MYWHKFGKWSALSISKEEPLCRRSHYILTPWVSSPPLPLYWLYQFSSVQSLSHTWLFATPRTAAYQASLSITNSQRWPKLMSIKLVMPSNHLILYHPLFLLPSIFPSIRAFANESVLCIKWPNYWSFSFNISPSSEYSGLISFKIDCFDLLAIQGTLKSLLQHHSSKAAILQHPAFFMVQLLHLYMTTGKSVDLTIRTFVGKVMSLPFNMLVYVGDSFSSKEEASFNFFFFKLVGG